jgi:hypothetical protein
MVFVALFTAAVTGLLAAIITLQLRTEFPQQIATVGDLSCWIVAHKGDLAPVTPGTWTREQVAARIRDITIEELDCAAAYREDAFFVRDLGMS